MYYDRIIIGAGLYGLYSAVFCGSRGENVLVLECENEPFQRATYINQARVHQGYHYPRSLSTALKSARYFKRFNEDYGFCINKKFKQIYATSAEYSWTGANQFKSFCDAAGIPCARVYPETFFKDDMCDGAFLTEEYTYDSAMLRDFFLQKIDGMKNVKISYEVTIDKIEKGADTYEVVLGSGKSLQTPFLLNATYASTNQILKLAGFEPIKIKYELCEIILCKIPSGGGMRDYGFTVMDGPFFSIMPFGKTGYHSLTSVTFTPHSTSYADVPNFPCQKNNNEYCNEKHLGNCNLCPAKPPTAYPYMSGLARKYLKDEYDFQYEKSLFSMKPILVSSEVDDSRPTLIKVLSKSPTFVSVLSGKINTVYDLDEVLENE